MFTSELLRIQEAYEAPLKRGEEEKDSRVEKREVFTLEIFDKDNDEAIEDMKYAKTYYSMDDAIEDGKRAWEEYNDGTRDIQVFVLDGEYELPNGSIYGEPVVVLEIGEDIITKEKSSKPKSAKTDESKKNVCESTATIRVYEEDSPINILRDKCWNCETLLADIESSGVEEKFNSLAADTFPEAVDMTEFNDWCRFDDDSIRQYLGITEEEGEEEEEG